MLADTSNPSIQKAKAGGSQSHGQPEKPSKTLHKETDRQTDFKTVSFDMYNKTLSKVKSFRQMYAKTGLYTLMKIRHLISTEGVHHSSHSQPTHKLQDSGCWAFPTSEDCQQSECSEELNFR